MTDREKHTSSQISPSNADDTSIVSLAITGQPIGLFVSAVATTQIAFLEFMSQCTLAWINASAGQTLARPSDSRIEQRKSPSNTSSTDHSAAVMFSGGDWLAVPVITGIEETLSDQFIKPRPTREQESDVLTLWERSNEFEVTHLVTTHMSDDHHDIA